MGTLDDKVAVVTGAARGLGRAIAERFVAEGAFVYVTDIASNEGDRVAEAFGDSAMFVRLDTSEADDWQRLIDMVTERNDRLDLLVNNAGVAYRFGVRDTEPADWRRVLDVNLTGPYLGLRASADMLSRSSSASVINISSVAGATGHLAAAYAASKAGLQALARAAALEFGAEGVRVNCIMPSVLDDTDIVVGDDSFKQANVALTPLRRAARTSDVVALAHFLASEESAFITGVDIPVDGGLTSAGLFTEIRRRARGA